MYMVYQTGFIEVSSDILINISIGRLAKMTVGRIYKRLNFPERVRLEAGFWFSPQGDQIVFLTINSTKVNLSFAIKRDLRAIFDSLSFVGEKQLCFSSHR